MKTKTQLTILMIAVFSIQFLACKKEADVTSSASASSSDLASTTARINLVAWYKFTNGSPRDYSGNGNRLSLHNVTLATDYMGIPNNAYYFDGQTSFMSAVNSSSLNPSEITLVALFKPMGFYNGEGETTRILMKGNDDQSNGDYFLGFHNTGQFYGTYGDNQFNSNGVGSPVGIVQLNTWYKMVYTYANGVGKLYINDTLAGREDKVASFNPNSSPLRIGITGRTDFPYAFNGVIDEIRIYNVALTKTQIAKVDAQLGQ